jgi:AAA domain
VRNGGLPWPNGDRAIEPVNVLMVTAEDAIDTEVVPRLAAARADLNRIHILKYIKTDKQQRQFLLVEDLAKVEEAIAQIGNVGLICIDPITAYMGGKTDSHKATEVRSQLGPLKDFAERTNVALSAITHPPKNASAKAIDHFIGSQAFIAAARVGHACFEEFEEDEETGEKHPTGRKLFANVKHNAHRQMLTLAYKIEELIIYPERFLQIKTAHVVWEKEAVDISADQAIAATRSVAKAAKEEEPASELMDLLRTMLDAGGGWCKQTDIAKQAKALGYSDRELATARKKSGIVWKRKGGLGDDGWWMWGWEGGKKPPRWSD